MKSIIKISVYFALVITSLFNVTAQDSISLSSTTQDSRTETEQSYTRHFSHLSNQSPTSQEFIGIHNRARVYRLVPYCSADLFIATCKALSVPQLKENGDINNFLLATDIYQWILSMTKQRQNDLLEASTNQLRSIFAQRATVKLISSDGLWATTMSRDVIAIIPKFKVINPGESITVPCKNIISCALFRELLYAWHFHKNNQTCFKLILPIGQTLSYYKKIVGNLCYTDLLEIALQWNLDELFHAILYAASEKTSKIDDNEFAQLPYHYLSHGAQDTTNIPFLLKCLCLKTSSQKDKKEIQDSEEISQCFDALLPNLVQVLFSRRKYVRSDEDEYNPLPLIHCNKSSAQEKALREMLRVKLANSISIPPREKWQAPTVSSFNLETITWPHPKLSICEINSRFLLIADKDGVHILDSKDRSSRDLKGPTNTRTLSTAAAAAAESTESNQTDTIPVKKVIVEEGYIIGLYEEGIINVWDSTTFDPVACFMPPAENRMSNQPQRVIAFGALKSKKIIVAYAHGLMRIFRIKDSKYRDLHVPTKSTPSCFVQCLPHTIAVGYEDGTVSMYNTKTDTLLAAIPAKQNKAKPTMLMHNNDSLYIQYQDNVGEKWFIPLATAPLEKIIKRFQ